MTNPHVSAVPAGWVVASHDYQDSDFPAPFDQIQVNSRNLGASVWIHITSGAMIAAVPTGAWNEHANYAFYYAAPNGTRAIALKDWTSDQPAWDASSVNVCISCHDQAKEYFNSKLSPALPGLSGLSGLGNLGTAQ